MKLILHFILLLEFIRIYAAAENLLVQTTHGPVRGFELGGEVIAFRGIPFATPPLGNLRWREPVDPIAWQNPILATEYKEMCVQGSIYGGKGSEDCLYLNVYKTPATASTSSLLPVLFYIYGGGLMGGSARDDFSSLLESSQVESNRRNTNGGLVIVEVSYRLNIFGFLATSELSKEQSGSSGNYGFMDQQKALQWVQNNIKAFGGDPKRVTIGGQSSGGTSAFALLASPRSQGLFSRAFSMSGSPNISMSLAEAEAQNRPVVDALLQTHQQHQRIGSISSSDSSGIGGETSHTHVLDRLRSLSAADLAAAVPIEWNTPGIWSLPKGPPSSGGQQYSGLAIVDGRVIPKSYTDAIASGSLIDVPLLYGSSTSEPDEAPDNDVSHLNDIEWYQYLQKTFSTWSNGRDIATNIYGLYPNRSSQMAYDEIVTDYGLTCAYNHLTHTTSLRGTRISPIYSYIHARPLHRPYLSPWTPEPFLVRYTFHDLFYFQLTGQWNKIGYFSDYQHFMYDHPYVQYKPSEEDIQTSRDIQRLFFDFIGPAGGYGETLTGGCSPVYSTTGTGSNANYKSHTVFVIMPLSKTGTSTTAGRLQSGMVANYKRDVCRYFESIGLTKEMFWWAN